MFADFLANIDAEGRVGRTPVDPVSTALNVYICDYAASSEDQVYFGHGALVDFGYAHHRYAQSQTPQGEGLYVFSPAGNSGNYLLNSTKRPARDQGPIHGYLPKFLLAGWHQVEPRSHADRPPYKANNRSTGYQESGLAGQLLSKTTFVAPVTFRVSDVEFSSNLPDTGIFAAAFGGGFDSAIGQAIRRRLTMCLAHRNARSSRAMKAAVVWCGFRSEARDRPADRRVGLSLLYKSLT